MPLNPLWSIVNVMIPVVFYLSNFLRVDFGLAIHHHISFWIWGFSVISYRFEYEVFRSSHIFLNEIFWAINRNIDIPSPPPITKLTGPLPMVHLSIATYVNTSGPAIHTRLDLSAFSSLHVKAKFHQLIENEPNG